jgi:hypothetical protein
LQVQAEHTILQLTATKADRHFQTRESCSAKRKSVHKLRNLQVIPLTIFCVIFCIILSMLYHQAPSGFYLAY